MLMMAVALLWDVMWILKLLLIQNQNGVIQIITDDDVSFHHCETKHVKNRKKYKLHVRPDSAVQCHQGYKRNGNIEIKYNNVLKVLLIQSQKSHDHFTHLVCLLLPIFHHSDSIFFCQTLQGAKLLHLKIR